MVKKDIKSGRKLDLVNCLMENSDQSISKIAEKTNMYRRTVWQKKKELEEDHTIWGYTAVINESKLNHVLYIAQFRIKPISNAFVDLIIRRLTTGAPSKEGVRVIDIFYMNGEYDVIIKFSAPDNITARKYYEKLRAVYKDFFRGDPSLSDMNFPLVKGGKLNPELERLYDYVPEINNQ